MTEFFAKPIFHGRRFDSHTLPVDVLRELQAYQEVVVQLAAAIWRDEHPDRVRLPHAFESGCKLTIQRLDEEAGCIGVVLGLVVACASPGEQAEIADAGVRFAGYYSRGRDQLTEMASQEVGERVKRLPLPAKARKALSHLGESLQADEYVLLGTNPDAREGVRLCPEFGRRFAQKARPPEDEVEFEGLFDSRSVREQRIGIVVSGRVVHCRVNAGDVCRWNQYLDHRVRVRGMGILSEDDNVLEVTTTDDLVLAEPAMLSIQFERLRRLESGWHGPESKPLDRQMLDRFEALLHQLEDRALPRPSLYANEDGEARAEWTRYSCEISVTASSATTCRLEVLDTESDEWSEQEYATGQVAEIADWLWRYLGRADAD